MQRAFRVQKRNAVSGGGKRELWCYVGAREQSVLAVEAYLGKNPVIWPIDYAISRDEDWSMVAPWLSEFKSKTGIRFPIVEAIANWWDGLVVRPVADAALVDSTVRTSDEEDQAVIDRLRRAGSNLRKPTNIRLYLYFFTSASAVDAQIEVLANNYRADVALPLGRPDDPEGSRDFAVLAEATAVPSIENISALNALFTHLAEAHGGMYDGWEAAVIR